MQLTYGVSLNLSLNYRAEDDIHDLLFFHAEKPDQSITIDIDISDVTDVDGYRQLNECVYYQILSNIKRLAEERTGSFRMWDADWSVEFRSLDSSMLTVVLQNEKNCFSVPISWDDMPSPQYSIPNDLDFSLRYAPFLNLNRIDSPSLIRVSQNKNFPNLFM